MAGHEIRGRSGRGDVRFARGGQPKRRPKPKNNAGSPSLVLRLGSGMMKFFGRSLKFMLTGVLAAVAVVAISALLVVGYLYVSNSDYFAVKTITISGINAMPSEEILAVTGLKRDHSVNILTFDLQEAESSLKSLPWIADAKVTRKMPDTVSIEVREHTPKLLVSLGRLYYLNEEGVPFKELTPGEKPDLPIVSGFIEDELLNPGPAVKEAMNEIFWLVEALSQRNDEFRLANVSEINYDAVRGLSIFAILNKNTTQENILEVKIGFGAYEEKFRRLGRVMAHLKLTDKTRGLVYLNLEASPRVTVRYEDKKQGTALNRGGSLEPGLRPVRLASTGVSIGNI